MGDMVLVEDCNALRGHWTIGTVKEYYFVRNELVRDVEVEIVKANGAKTTFPDLCLNH